MTSIDELADVDGKYVANVIIMCKSFLENHTLSRNFLKFNLFDLPKLRIQCRGRKVYALTINYSIAFLRFYNLYSLKICT